MSRPTLGPDRWSVKLENIQYGDRCTVSFLAVDTEDAMEYLESIYPKSKWRRVMFTAYGNREVQVSNGWGA